jgi:hypothetical protein
MFLGKRSSDYLKYYYKQLYFIEAEPTKIQEVECENDTAELRKQAFKNYPYLKTFFPEIVFE